MPIPTIPVSFQNVVKNPYTYLLITVVSLLWYFVYTNTNLARKQDTDCQQQVIELRADYKQALKDKDDLTTALLIKNGVITKLTVKVDSVSIQKQDENE
jgi:hypothetical protein